MYVIVEIHPRIISDLKCQTVVVAAPVLTYVLLVVLALSSHRLLWSAVTVLRASTQAVRHTVHLL